MNLKLFQVDMFCSDSNERPPTGVKIKCYTNRLSATTMVPGP